MKKKQTFMYLKISKKVTSRMELQKHMQRRTVRVDKKWKVCDIVKKILIESKNYLRHRSHVVNVSNIFPLIKDSFDGKYIELDFSENIAMKPKFEECTFFLVNSTDFIVQLLNQVNKNMSIT